MNYSEDSSKINQVNETMGLYVKDINAKPFSSTKKKQFTFTAFFDNKMAVIELIRKGLPYEIFNLIKNIIPFTEEDWANYLNLSKKSLQRYSNDKKHLFKPIHTEKILEIAEVTTFGKTVFDTTEQFYLWLNTPSFALNNFKPSELLKDSYGKELVLEELNRIEHGVFV